MTDKKGSYTLILFLCWLSYTSAYVGRLNYSASMVSVLADMNITKVQGGAVASAFFLCYGAGQLVNGLLCRRYNSKIALFLSLAVSAGINILMSFMHNIIAMAVFWGINGIVQSVLWSTIIKTLSRYLPDRMLGKAIAALSTTVAVGTFTAYGSSALFSYLGNWRWTFVFSGSLLFVVSLVWFFVFGQQQKLLSESEACNAETVTLPVTAKNPALPRSVLIPVFVFLAAGAIANGFVRDGVTSWVPSLIHENFDLAGYFSILLTLSLPMILIFGAYVANKLQRLFINHQFVNFVCFCAGVAVLLALSFVFSKILALTMLLFALVACMMSAINNVVTSMIPLHLRKLGNSGMFAGLINTFCYAGSTVSSIGLGAAAENSGWQIFLWILAGVCAAAALVLSFASRHFKKTVLVLLEQ